MSVIITRNIDQGDAIMVDKKGRRFMARVTSVEEDGTFKIKPIERWPSWHTVTSREIIGHWIATVATRRAGV